MLVGLAKLIWNHKEKMTSQLVSCNTSIGKLKTGQAPPAASIFLHLIYMLRYKIAFGDSKTCHLTFIHPLSDTALPTLRVTGVLGKGGVQPAQVTSSSRGQ